MSNHTSDLDLTLQQYVTQYTTGQMSVGNTEEIKEYLKKRWERMKGMASYEDVRIAYLKTDLPNKKMQHVGH